jgi:uncharacterized repeat protein (TIGR02543 family)
VSVNAGESTSAPSPVPTPPAGFDFDGWYTQASGGSRVTFPYTPYAPMPGSGINLYAHWKYASDVTDDHSWAAAITAANTAAPGSFVIGIGSNSFAVGASGGLDNPAINSNVNLTVTGSGTISLSANGHLLQITGANVTLDGPTLQGRNGNTGSLVTINGGSFTLQSGTITGNTNGGGVYIDAASAFIMTGGTITGNTAGSAGGGVYAGGSSAFTMTGGTITGNTAGSSGGGVMVGGSAFFTMTGGTITGNTAGSSGGGVVVSGGTFTINSPATQTSVRDNTLTGGTPNNVNNSGGAITINGVPSGGW